MHPGGLFEGERTGKDILSTYRVRRCSLPVRRCPPVFVAMSAAVRRCSLPYPPLSAGVRCQCPPVFGANFTGNGQCPPVLLLVTDI